MKIARMIFGLIFLIGCAAAIPYQITNFFIDEQAINELRAKRIAILPFNSTVSDYSSARKVTDEFNLQLGKLGVFEIVERVNIDKLYKEQDLDPGRIDQTTAVKIGKMLGAHGIILGEVTQYTKGKVGISIRLVNVETGKHIWQAKDTLYGTDPRVKALVNSWRERTRLRNDKEFLAQILCQLLAESFRH